ncbi:MAG: hypothetical protein ABIT01_13415 [Thermoanaerobaculia bacterium]
MRSPAAAIAWEFRRRHRWGLMAVIAYLLFIATLRLSRFGAAERVDFEDAESFALAVVVPLTATFLYLLAVFTHGLAGDLAARQSMYPARMFTLPVTAAALAGWPMVYGTVSMATLWTVTRLFGVWPSGIDVPVLWPALLAASLLAWTQALTWMPYGLPGLRVIVTILWLAAIDAVVMVALHFRASEPVMLALLAPHLPLAYLAARHALSRARRGDVPDWRGLFLRGGTPEQAHSRATRRFSSPTRAQEWLEWKRHGRSLPLLVGILLPVELSLLVVFRETPVLVLETLVLALTTPPIMAAFVGATVAKGNPSGSDPHGLSPFIATRPLTSASLVAAKLTMTIRSTLAAWVLVLIAIPAALVLSGTTPLVLDRAREEFAFLGAPRAVALGCLIITALVMSTWKQLVNGLFIGLSGREWAVKASIFGVLSFLAVIGPAARWLFGSSAAIAVVWNALPWIIAVLVCVKLTAAAWVAFRLQQNRLLGDGALVLGAACWDVSVFVLYGVLVWLVPEVLVRGSLLALVAIQEVPLARISAAPLALAWNRHR